MKNILIFLLVCINFYLSNHVVICKVIRKILEYLRKFIFPLDYKRLILYWLNFNITTL